MLQIDLTDEDEFTLSLRRPVIRVPDPKEREDAREGLIRVLGQFHERMKEEPEEQVSSAIDETFRELRSPRN